MSVRLFSEVVLQRRSLTVMTPVVLNLTIRRPGCNSELFSGAGL